MNPDHPRYADWDSAYVLGALSPTDRREYEEHLAGCEECRRSITELASMPGLLARLSPDRATALLDETDVATSGPRSDLIDDLLRIGHEGGHEGGQPIGHEGNAGIPAGAPPTAHDGGLPDSPPSTRAHGTVNDLERHKASRRIRRPLIWAATAAAALLVLLGAILVPLTLTRAPAETLALQSLTDLPITATVTLTTADWGTRINLNCTYEGDTTTAAPTVGWPYALYVVAADGTRTAVSTWRASPGETARLDSATATSLSDIAAIEIGTIDGNTTLMRGTLSG